ncbi:hypothetical protein [Saccharospirillum impatiens]|uniref:hypothetical protein n=1 Tax=Saccharospirillum impatiens TaxID=169438 RepID=UPI0004230F15|nr:hypothetical protein [Saccharospirillum impatiens]
MSEQQHWLIKPENYRALQNIRKRIRAIYGDDIRITSTQDLAILTRYRNDKDAKLNALLSDFEARAPFDLSDWDKPTVSVTGQPHRVYRGQVMA